MNDARRCADGAIFESEIRFNVNLKYIRTALKGSSEKEITINGQCRVFKFFSRLFREKENEETDDTFLP